MALDKVEWWKLWNRNHVSDPSSWDNSVVIVETVQKYLTTNDVRPKGNDPMH